MAAVGCWKGVDEWHGDAGEQAVQLLIKRGRLERFEADDLTALAVALLARAVRRLELTATAAQTMGMWTARTWPPTTPTG
jgi:hypothetical protein